MSQFQLLRGTANTIKIIPTFEHVEPHRGIRTDRYKFIDFYLQPEQFELYDLETDPDEKKNLYGTPGHEELGKKLRARLEELRRETAITTNTQ